MDAVPVPWDAHVLDLAAGTGKLTRLLARRFASVVAIEPDDAMRALIERAELGEKLRALVTESRRFLPRTDLHWTRLRG